MSADAARRIGDATIELYWLPLGAGGHSVRVNGRVYEALVALRDRRPRKDLYHAALEVRRGGECFVIEMTPAPDNNGAQLGVVVEGPVGSRLVGRWRLFRYEVRRWRGGAIPDIGEAVGSPLRISVDDEDARRLLALVPDVPALVWGRDELGVGEMWNSNSVVAWLIARTGLESKAIRPPSGGRAPGWGAGQAAAEQHGTGGLESRHRRSRTNAASARLGL